MGALDLITWTSPTIEIGVSADLSDHDVYVTIEQKRGNGSVVSEVTNEADSVTYDGEATIVTVTFSQQQTGTFLNGKAEIMVNAVDSEGGRQATYSADVNVLENLARREMTPSA